MSLAKALTAELRRLGASSVAYPPTEAAGLCVVELPASAEQPAVRIELFDLDRYSATLRRLTVAGAALAPIDAGALDAAAQRSARLSALAQAVIARLGYLEEPLALIEADAGEQQAQLRSAPPLREDGTISYWELTISADAQPTLSLARYQWSPELPEREALPYPAAFPQLGRIAESLAQALAQ